MRRMRWAAIGCFVVAVGGAGYVGWDLTRDDAPSRADKAISACEAQAREQVTVVGKLEFEEVTAEETVGETYIDVSAKVIGPNGFGARVKTNYFCRAHEMMDGTFQAEVR